MWLLSGGSIVIANLVLTFVVATFTTLPGAYAEGVLDVVSHRVVDSESKLECHDVVLAFEVDLR